MGEERKIVQNAVFRGKRHDNKILKVQILLSRNFVVMAQAPSRGGLGAGLPSEDFLGFALRAVVVEINAQFPEVCSFEWVDRLQRLLSRRSPGPPQSDSVCEVLSWCIAVSHFSGKKKQHKHKLFGPDFPRTFLTLTPGRPWVKKFLPITGAAEKRTFWCGRPRFSARTSMT